MCIHIVILQLLTSGSTELNVSDQILNYTTEYKLVPFSLLSKNFGVYFPFTNKHDMCERRYAGGHSETFWELEDC